MLHHHLKVAAIIPARGGSKGILDKNIRNVGGKPLIEWSVLRAKNTIAVDSEVYVTSDSDKILDVARAAGAQVIRRPDALSGDTATSESALIHAVETIEKQKGEVLDIIVFLQCTSPIRKPDDISNALQVFEDSKADSLFSSHPIRDFFLWKREKETYRAMNYDYRNRPRRQDIPVTHLENGSFYIFKRDLLMQSNNRLGGKIATYEMDKIHSLQIDEMDELELCDYFLKKLYC